ncbi:four helix bundle protein [Vibrio breoganii]|uniref:Four helix bundle protein n=1 Tax=Vibrio breoganii TaxID=553239 RepID=A0AAN0XYR7_9VIBR|nr:four helix bundle protein [Vibrio breoganii]ANO34988.1 four helix bundle protein [Vibrio breoganii]OED98600.1 four helix bundle protein [Vibrio breoganii ZF-55]PMG84394.1 four helix bundle protein [Vibrio breoganii]PMK42619.1 four helix bundle protein [Vibrio breoganii]PMO31931.1 four helix bundle protein [Vibrio breoganii]
MNYEKLAVWERAVGLSADIYAETKHLNDFGFRDQLTRSGLSVPSNIAEGMTRSSHKEKIRFLDISRASLAEAKTQIIIGLKINYLSKNKAEAWLQETDELSAMITGLMNKLKASS